MKKRGLAEVLTPAYRHGFFSALAAGPVVVPGKWLDVVVPPASLRTLDSRYRELAKAIDEYNAVTEELLLRPLQFIDHTEALCSDAPEAMFTWFHGFSRGINVRALDWKPFFADDAIAELITPLSFLSDLEDNPEKRPWLDDDELRRNVAKALGIAAVRIAEQWREREHAKSVEPKAPKRARRQTGRQKTGHPWAFRTKLRRGAFGWRSSSLAVTRLNEALREIRTVAKTDPSLASDGAVLLIERISPAFEQVDSSSGALGAAINRAVEELAAVFSVAQLDRAARIRGLERLWQACVDDGMGYLDVMENTWGEFCGTLEIASWWASESLSNVRAHWQRPRAERGYLKGSIACLSALFKAERYDDILDLLSIDEGSSFWDYREWGFRALVAMGRRAEALRYAEATNDINDAPAIARACEDLLLASGMADEAYERYAFDAMREATTYAATFRAMCKRYPHKEAAVILRDLAARTPGREGKWFAAAKDAGLYDEALRLANASPCDPMTLARAARDFAEKLPEFAIEASAASLRWMAQGYGYELTTRDIVQAYDYGLTAAERLDRADTFRKRARAIVEAGHASVREALSRQLGSPP